MGLPKINENNNFTQIKLPSGKSIGVKGWRVKEEKELLFSSERIKDDDFVGKIKTIQDFLRCCVDDKDKFELLSENDLKKIALESRKIAKGDDVEYSQKCSKEGCNFIFEDVMKLSTSEVIELADLKPLKVNDNLTITFKEVPLPFLAELQKRFGTELNKFLFYYLVNSIEAVTYSGTVYTEFTESEAVDFIDELNPNDLKFIFEEFVKKSSKVYLKKIVKCGRCGKDVEVVVEDILSFLVL